MKCTIPEISWHNRDPVLSVDVQVGKHKSADGEAFWRIATGGADSHVLIWHLKLNEIGAAQVAYVADLERHQKAVNVVRFSPSGEILASGDDESAIILWKAREDTEPPPLAGDESQNKEQWTSWKVLRGHLEDIYDVSWSPDSNSLVSGSVDNTAIIWDVRKGRSNGILSDYKGFVQGVAWDPCDRYVCTLSTDRQCRLVDVNTRKTVQRVGKARIPTPPGHPLEGKSVRLFHDDTFKSFFRRLTFSADGSLILAPSGIVEPGDSTEKVSNATIVFSRHNMKEPIMILPSLDQCTIAVRCCPLYFELRENGPTPIIPLPYRMVFAVATQCSVLIYDTQQVSPIAVVSDIHYTRLTDVAWSSDGNVLMISSTDGYCSIIHFQDEELGETYKAGKPLSLNSSANSDKKSNQTKSRKAAARSSASDEPKIILDVDSNAMDVDVFESKPPEVISRVAEVNDAGAESARTAKRETSEAPAAVKPTDEGCVVAEETEDIKLVYHEESDGTEAAKATSHKKTPPKPGKPIVSARTPRRVQLTTLSSPKRAKKDEKGGQRQE